MVNGVDHPYGYNGKEENNELGLNTLDYGARNYSADLGRWMNIDPLADKYTNLSPYSYVANNVINAIDPDGRLIIYVGGLLMDRGPRDQWRNQLSFNHFSGDVTDKGGPYWSTKPGKVNSFGRATNLVNTFNSFHNDNHNLFVSGSSHYNSQASDRMEEGKIKAKEFHKLVQSGAVTLKDGEAIRIVSHSQGGAHAAGYADQLMTYKDENGNNLYNVEVVYYITPHQGADITHPNGIAAFQFSHPNDAISGEGSGIISLFNGGKHYGKISNISSDNFFESVILGGEGQPAATGATGNRNGHNVTDNQQHIINVLNDFCKQNPGKCKEISLNPSGGNN